MEESRDLQVCFSLTSQDPPLQNQREVEGAMTYEINNIKLSSHTYEVRGEEGVKVQ